MTKAYLTIVGLIYLGLSLWCSFAPQHTSAVVGLDLRPGAGDSEFLTVYGGLEMGLALLLLAPLCWPDSLKYSLWACVVVHVCIVLFRSIGFLVYGFVPGMTLRLAIGEWVILLIGLYCVVRAGGLQERKVAG